jgi:hypothetical protein
MAYSKVRIVKILEISEDFLGEWLAVSPGSLCNLSWPRDLDVRFRPLIDKQELILALGSSLLGDGHDAVAAVGQLGQQQLHAAVGLVTPTEAGQCGL